MKIRERIRDVVEQSLDARAHQIGVNAELLSAIDRCSRATEEHDRTEFYTALLQANLFVAIEEHPQRWRFGRAEENACPVPLKGCMATSGKRLLTVFTDAAAMRNYFAVVPYWIEMPGAAYLKMIAPLDFDELVINPFDPKRKMLRPGCTVTRAEVLELARRIAANADR